MTTTLETMLATGSATENVQLGPYTTYKSGGPARYMVVLETREDLHKLVSLRRELDLPFLIVGRGSNLVVADDGFDGVAVRLGPGFSTVEVEDGRLVGGGSAPLSLVARTSVESGLGGLEFFVGIPGSVGGAVRQNAGCFGSETRDVLEAATVLDLAEASSRSMTPDQLEMSYRHSNVTSDQLVVEAVFRGSPAEPGSGKALLREITRWRRDHQPGGTLNAGSVFKNPVHISAGELIDSIGLKGLSVGDASVSAKHANFIVAGPEATSRDIKALVERVKDRVFEESGTMLEPEIQFVGFDQ